MSAECPPAALALDQAAEQVGACHAPGMRPRRRPGPQKLRDAPELRLRHDGREGVVHPHGRSLVLRRDSPDERPCVGLIVQHVVDGRLRPELPSGARDSFSVEGPCYVEDALSRLGHSEHALHDRRRPRFDLQFGALLRPVLYVHLPVAVRGVRSDPEASRSGLAHPPHDLLRQIFTIELVHALDDRLHQLARGGVVGVLGDRNHADTLASQHRFESDSVLSLAREPREFPYEYLLKGSLRLAGLVDHLPELGPVGDAPALRLVHVLAGDDVAVFAGIVPERT